MTEQIGEYLKRPVLYNNIDGLGEMGIGVLWLGLGFFGWLEAVSVQGSVWHSKLFRLACIAVLVLGVHFVPKALKNRITYRRTGYVKYLSGKKNIVAGVIAGVVAGTIALAQVYMARNTPNAMVVLGSLVMTAFYAYATKMHGLWRWAIAVGIALGPVIVYRLPLSHAKRDLVSVTVLSLCWLISGLITFCLYLRNTKPAEPEAR